MPKLSVLALAALPVLAAPAPDPLEVRVDERFELMSVVCRLADYWEYRQGSVQDYNAAVDAHFGPFREHAAVKLARELRRRVGYSAIPQLALRAQDARDFRPRFDLRAPATGLDAWDPAAAERFLDALAVFARESRAETFFAAQAPFYRRLEEACRKGLLARLDLTWFERKFGRGKGDTFRVVAAPLNGGGNYGGWAPKAGRREVFAFMGTGPAGRGALPAFGAGQLPTLVHEFLHSFVNPWVEARAGELRGSGEALAAPVADQLRRRAYGDPVIALQESLVRAFTIRYLQDHGDAPAALSQELQDSLDGFYWVPELASLPEAAALAPALGPALKGIAGRAERLLGEAPAREAALFAKANTGALRVLSLDPPIGAQEVDPAVPVLRAVFDHPILERHAIANLGFPVPEFPDDGRPLLDATGTVLTLPIRLKPRTTYRFTFTFWSRSGSTLLVPATFTTR